MHLACMSWPAGPVQAKSLSVRLQYRTRLLLLPGQLMLELDTSPCEHCAPEVKGLELESVCRSRRKPKAYARVGASLWDCVKLQHGTI
jgi:hypothetical protein